MLSLSHLTRTNTINVEGHRIEVSVAPDIQLSTVVPSTDGKKVLIFDFCIYPLGCGDLAIYQACFEQLHGQPVEAMAFQSTIAVVNVHKDESMLSKDNRLVQDACLRWKEKKGVETIATQVAQSQRILNNKINEAVRQHKNKHCVNLLKPAEYVL